MDSPSLLPLRKPLRVEYSSGAEKDLVAGLLPTKGALPHAAALLYKHLEVTTQVTQRNSISGLPWRPTLCGRCDLPSIT